MATIGIQIQSTIASARTYAGIPGMISLKLPGYEGDVTFSTGDDALSCKLADAINKVIQEHVPARSSSTSPKAA